MTSAIEILVVERSIGNGMDDAGAPGADRTKQKVPVLAAVRVLGRRRSE